MSQVWVIEHRPPTVVVRGFKADERLRTWGFKPFWSAPAHGHVVDDRHMADILARAEREGLRHRVAATGEKERRSVERAKSHLETAAKEVIWQIEHRAWEVLGYASWDEMREKEYGGVAVMVPSKERPALTIAAREQGLTQQQIADTFGVGQSTVDRDLKTHMGNQPATVSTSRGERPATYAKHTPSAEPEQPHAVTEWSQQVQAVSATVPITDLTTDEVRWLAGAAEYLLGYCHYALELRGEEP